MSVRYVDHPAQVSIDPAAYWFPFWNTSTNAAERTTIDNAIASAVLPGANLVDFSVPLSKHQIIGASTILGRNSSGAGIPQPLAISADLSISVGGVLGLTNTYQPLDADLTAIAALVTQPYGRSLLTAADASAARTLLQLLTPANWAATDKLVTTHLGSMLADIGAGGALNISPITSATNADILILSKGSGSVILADESTSTLLSVVTAGFTFDGGHLTINSTVQGTTGGLGSIVTAGGIRADKRVLGTGLTSMTQGTIELYNADDDNVVTLQNAGAAGEGVLTIVTTGAADGVSITSTTAATDHLTGALRVAGGLSVVGALYLGAADAVHILNDGSARFASGAFLINSDGSTSIGPGNLVVDADGNLTSDGILTHTSQPVVLGAGAVTFAATSSFVVITGDGLGNVLGTITGGDEGSLLDIYFVDNLVTLTDTAAATPNSMDLSAAFVSSANDMISFRKYNGKWFERSRSVN